MKLEGIPFQTTDYRASKPNPSDLMDRLNLIAPGPTETPVFGKLGAPPEAIEMVKAQFLKMVPLGRIAGAHEISRWILNLADPSVTWVTGQILSIDGGMSL